MSFSGWRTAARRTQPSFASMPADSARHGPRDPPPAPSLAPSPCLAPPPSPQKAADRGSDLGVVGGDVGLADRAQALGATVTATTIIFGALAPPLHKQLCVSPGVLTEE